ncbi:PAS domain S-box protein [Alicyclobacillus cycloheptanicus]|uniref:histidine kinase n=1 Tax=Alicyclobacillus cycloheptanicus TaxID=1457 RepID=A0ABT9XIG5_9BACL|nr:ATP-binding protein [Alicyclobacillus cycloheptanicus]MDQ0189992.1 PAS domain S-box-containing protein [Alicyclobacillus cycloheptanicus]WDM00099.1 PAS domain S-box protein [Alicyclobacillus cycloheptanicus]
MKDFGKVKFSRSPAMITAEYVVVCYMWHGITGLFFNHFYDQGFPWFVNSSRFAVLIAGTTVFVYTLCKRLWRSKELFESIFNHTTDAICVMDLSMNVVQVNPAFESLFGYQQADALHAFSVIPADQQETTWRHFQDVVEARVPFAEYEGTRMCKNGRVVHVLIRLSPLRNARGDIFAVSALTKDITELRQAQTLLMNLEKLEMVGQLAAGVAHEIRNPLTSLKGFLKLLPDVPSDTQRTYLSIMQSELARIEDITGEMLALAKPQVYQYRLVQIQSLLDDVITLISPQAHMKNVEIAADCEDSTITLAAEPSQLKQVFLNVMKNGIEAMESGGTLHLRVSRQADEVTVAFTDEGIGIPEDVLAKVGNPFFTTKQTGVGLGLLVSRNIVAHHQGSLCITSEMGKGTTVTITLPAADVDDGRVSDQTRAMVWQS